MALDVQLRFGYVGLERMFRDYEYVAFRRTLEFPFWVSSRIGRGREWSQLTYFRTNWPTYSPKCKDPDNDQQLCNAPTLKWSRVIKQIQNIKTKDFTKPKFYIVIVKCYVLILHKNFISPTPILKKTMVYFWTTYFVPKENHEIRLIRP